MKYPIAVLKGVLSDIHSLTSKDRSELQAAIKLLEKAVDQKSKVAAYRKRVSASKKKQKPLKRTKRSSDYLITYLLFFGYTEDEYKPSELTGDQLDDVHHIKADGMGGTKRKPKIEELIGLSRMEHDYFGDRTHFREFLEFAHKNFMETRTPLIETQYADNKILQEYLNYRRRILAREIISNSPSF